MTQIIALPPVITPVEKIARFRQAIIPAQQMPELGKHVLNVACPKDYGLSILDQYQLFPTNGDPRRVMARDALDHIYLFGAEFMVRSVEKTVGGCGYANWQFPSIGFVQGRQLIRPQPFANDARWQEVKFVRPESGNTPFFINVATGDVVLHADIVMMIRNGRNENNEHRCTARIIEHVEKL